MITVTGPGSLDLHVNEVLVKSIIERVELCLNDPVWLSGNRSTAPDGSAILKVVGQGTLSVADKEKIKSLYISAGWAECTVTNSGDSGERPGLWGVRLSSPPPNKN